LEETIVQELPQILYCHCAFAQVISEGVKHKVLEQLTAAGVDFEAVPDLCEMSARRDPLLKDFANQPNLRIAACYPRAVKGLFTAAECSLPENGPEIINMRVLNGDEAASALLGKAARTESSSPVTRMTT
jgi:hypothetical protein